MKSNKEVKEKKQCWRCGEQVNINIALGFGKCFKCAAISFNEVNDKYKQCDKCEGTGYISK